MPDPSPARPRVLIAEPDRFSARAAAIVRAVAEVELREVAGEDLRQAFTVHDAIWIRLARRIDAEMLGTRPRCRTLVAGVTGLDHVDLEACAARGVRVLSLKGETAFLKDVRATAELTVGLLLALLRHIPAAAAHVRAGGWDRGLFRGHELFGKTAGVVGMGRLGAQVARLLAAFGMHVLGYDLRPDFPEGLAERCPGLLALLARSDVVTLHVPYGPETRHLIGQAELEAMKSTAVLVNTSRGGVVDEAALLTALATGRVAGAALDVLEGEPAIDPGHAVVRALASHNNLLVVPHLGGYTTESLEKTEVFLAERLVALLAAAPA
jgi:D-3-phosphoglycerate dehydrogenase